MITFPKIGEAIIFKKKKSGSNTFQSSRPLNCTQTINISESAFFTKIGNWQTDERGLNHETFCWTGMQREVTSNSSDFVEI